MGKAEATSMLMPDAFGGSSSKNLSENSKVVNKLVNKGAPESTATQIASSLPKYWGGLPQTSGPPYLGVIICLLGLIGFVLYKNPLRWGLLAVTVLAILMSWGKYLPGFNTFLFDHLPLYNKFRAPSMSLVITQLTIPIIAVLILQQLLFRDNAKELLRTNFKKILYTVGGLLALLVILYIGMDYSWVDDGYILSNKWDNSGTDEIGRLIISGMKLDRSAMFGEQVLRTLGFAVALLALLYMFLRNIIKPIAVSIILMVICTADLLIVDKDYLNSDNYRSPEELVSEHFTPTEIDKQILQDKDPDFRVFTANTNLVYDSRPSYFYKSVSGYHPARLRTYQDIIDKYLTQYQNLIQQFGPAAINQNVLNMLNTKYVVYGDQQTNQTQLAPNPNAYGSCWLVKHVKTVDNRVTAFQLLGTTQLKDTAIVEKSFSNLVVQPQWDSASSIRLTKFDNDTMEYKASCKGPQFAVFSEVYYPKGWNAYVDGKKTDYCNVDYILRGISLPAGEHTVKFIFEPDSYKKGIKISYAASFLVLLFFAGGLFMQWRQDRKSKAKAA
ncbi:MAG: YfhO family protein [Bacteroidota bacterium]